MEDNMTNSKYIKNQLVYVGEKIKLATPKGVIKFFGATDLDVYSHHFNLVYEAAIDFINPAEIEFQVFSDGSGYDRDWNFLSLASDGRAIFYKEHK
jgi:hypothetical protein